MIPKQVTFYFITIFWNSFITENNQLQSVQIIKNLNKLFLNITKEFVILNNIIIALFFQYIY